eukprot:3326018-Pyramimonas_sp.AAC.1
MSATTPPDGGETSEESSSTTIHKHKSSVKFLERGDVWPALLDVAGRRVPNHYKALLELAGETPETAQQIEKDLPRTFSGRKELVQGSPMWGRAFTEE